MCLDDDAYVTDFHSDDTEVVWPHVNDDDNDSVSTVLSQSRRCSRQRVYEFGEFEETYGWVQCRSRSLRGHVYFHNMHSGCDTWYRPVSRRINIPAISLEKISYTDDVATSDLELMSVSDDEREHDMSAATRDHNGSSKETLLSILARWYCTSQVNFNTKDTFSESSDAFANKRYGKTDRWIVLDDKWNNNNCGDDDSQARSPLSLANYLETEILVEKGKVNTECRRRVKDDDDNSSTTSSSSVSTAPRRVVFGAPRLKKIGFEEQVVKWQDTRAPKERGPRKIICEMFGVRTISYDLPGPDEVRPEAGVKSTRLSDSDSDDGELLPSLQPNVVRKTSSFPYESVWRDFTKDLHQPLLSDPSSSPSSWSTKSSSSSGSDRSTSSSTSTCSTCSTCSTSCE